MVMPYNQTIGAFLEALASPAATPGGGGAAALSGAMGAALISMICNLTIGRPNFTEVEAAMQDILTRSELLRARLAEMVNKDAQAFSQVMAAYQLPQESDEEKRVRRAAIQEGLKAATLAPLAIAQACADVIELGQRAIEMGNPNAVGDAGVGVLCARAGLKSAALSALINLAMVKDEAFVNEHRSQLDEILAKHDGLTGELHELAQGKF